MYTHTNTRTHTHTHSTLSLTQSHSLTHTHTHTHRVTHTVTHTHTHMHRELTELNVDAAKYLLSLKFLVQKVIGVAQDALCCSLAKVKFSLETLAVFQDERLKAL